MLYHASGSTMIFWERCWLDIRPPGCLQVGPKSGFTTFVISWVQDLLISIIQLLLLGSSNILVNLFHPFPSISAVPQAGITSQAGAEVMTLGQQHKSWIQERVEEVWWLVAFKDQRAQYCCGCKEVQNNYSMFSSSNLWCDLLKFTCPFYIEYLLWHIYAVFLANTIVPDRWKGLTTSALFVSSRAGRGHVSKEEVGECQSDFAQRHGVAEREGRCLSFCRGNGSLDPPHGLVLVFANWQRATKMSWRLCIRDIDDCKALQIWRL